MRRRWLILLPVAIGLTVPGLLKRPGDCAPSRALIRQNRQPSSAADAVLTDLDRLDEALPPLADRLLTPSQLEQIVREFDLYRDARAKAGTEEGVRRLRQDIRVQREADDSFRVSYPNCDARVAQSVTAQVVSLFTAQSEGKESFAVVETASLPAPPDVVARARQPIAGAVSGLLLGLVLVAFLEYRNRGLVGKEDVAHTLMLPVLGSIGVLRPEREWRLQRFRRVALDVVGGLILTSAILLVLWRL